MEGADAHISALNGSADCQKTGQMTPDKRGSILLGTQGFSFKDWVGPFYPSGTQSRTYLEEYAKHFQTVEIDSTFYAIPRGTVVEGWRERTPSNFRIAAKFPKLITHEKKLDGALQALGEKLALLTLQFAYDFGPENFEVLDQFLQALPGGTRYAVEVRNRKWLNKDLGEMLSNHNVALVLQDLHYMPRLDWITADFTVIRWLGRRKEVEQFDRIQIDKTDILERWAEKVGKFLDDGVDVYGYFNNHFAGHSPASVKQFAEMMGYDPGEPPQQGTLQWD
jgi:uncharacterized protein YecE (DUF72 family)